MGSILSLRQPRGISVVGFVPPRWARAREVRSHEDQGSPVVDEACEVDKVDQVDKVDEVEICFRTCLRTTGYSLAETRTSDTSSNFNSTRPAIVSGKLISATMHVTNQS